MSIMAENTDSASPIQAVALTAQKNTSELAQAAIATQAELAVVSNEAHYADLKQALSGSGIEVAAGPSGMQEAVAREADMVLSAITGAAALEPTMGAINQGANVALANKESLVCAGNLMLEAAREKGAAILPVDSEHNAIFQVLDRPERVEKLVLTASGGPFRRSSLSVMREATPEKAVAHPNWSMGAKISVDSATMMNKGLELIEAAYLFNMDEADIDVLVHPQSIIHSMVSYDDGSVLAQLGMPDMRTPIAYAFAWPNRMTVETVERLDLAKIGQLDFECHDPERFPAINIARRAFRAGSWAPCVLNAANEIAVEAFLQRQIGFLGIVDLVDAVLRGFEEGNEGMVQNAACFDDVRELDSRAREVAKRKLLV